MSSRLATATANPCFCTDSAVAAAGVSAIWQFGVFGPFGAFRDSARAAGLLFLSPGLFGCLLQYFSVGSSRGSLPALLFESRAIRCTAFVCSCWLLMNACRALLRRWRCLAAVAASRSKERMQESQSMPAAPCAALVDSPGPPFGRSPETLEVRLAVPLAVY